MPSPAPPTKPTAIRLTLRNCGHVPTHKNTKMVLWNKKLERPMLITKPEIRKWMDAVIRDFESQLRSEFQIRGIAITTDLTRRSPIASLLPLDDCWKWIREHSVNTLIVTKGEEGADVLIERIEPDNRATPLPPLPPMPPPPVRPVAAPVARVIPPPKPRQSPADVGDF